MLLGHGGHNTIQFQFNLVLRSMSERARVDLEEVAGKFGYPRPTLGLGTAVGRARRAIHAPVDSGCTGNLTWNRNWLVNIRPRLVGGKNRLGEPGWESPAHGSHRGQHGAREGGV